MRVSPVSKLARTDAGRATADTKSPMNLLLRRTRRPRRIRLFPPILVWGATAGLIGS